MTGHRYSYSFWAVASTKMFLNIRTKLVFHLRRFKTVQRLFSNLYNRFLKRPEMNQHWAWLKDRLFSGTIIGIISSWWNKIPILCDGNVCTTRSRQILRLSHFIWTASHPRTFTVQQKPWRKENTDMEISAHKLNLLPLLSLTVLPDILSSSEKEQSTFWGWVVLSPFSSQLLFWSCWKVSL